MRHAWKEEKADGVTPFLPPLVPEKKKRERKGGEAQRTEEVRGADRGRSEGKRGGDGGGGGGGGDDDDDNDEEDRPRRTLLQKRGEETEPKGEEGRKEGRRTECECVCVCEREKGGGRKKNTLIFPLEE